MFLVGSVGRPQALREGHKHVAPLALVGELELSNTALQPGVIVRSGIKASLSQLHDTILVQFLRWVSTDPFHSRLRPARHSCSGI